MDIKASLTKLHEEENELNKAVAKIDGQMKNLVHKKAVLTKQISKNMKARNWLIKKL